MAVETCTFICYSTVLDTFWPRLPCNDCAAGEVLEFEDTDLDGGLAGEIRLTLNGIAGEYEVTWGAETFTFSGAASVPPAPSIHCSPIIGQSMQCIHVVSLQFVSVILLQ